MSNTSSSSTVNIRAMQLNQAASLSVLVLSLISVIPGGIGLIFNILIFTQLVSRNEAYVVYFFSSTCYNIFIVLIMQPLCVVAASSNLDLANYNLGICQIQWYALYGTRAIASWLIVLACLDRFFHSSSNTYVRQLSSLKSAKVTVIISSMIIHIP
ncbi:unnamed protein product [Adineta ricciae]|uniref:G-protein coupled receptors family 1 profile domain-containing protein n=1 Tax=Adineta ricciae TaxID=249248 RepID=A0A815QRT6_ADIRI|nr:unnamed protein product [Adineta ricciae]CAF1466885.1 unnamed protein product [Adineta ricciae]